MRIWSAPVSYQWTERTFFCNRGVVVRYLHWTKGLSMESDLRHNWRVRRWGRARLLQISHEDARLKKKTKKKQKKTKEWEAKEVKQVEQSSDNRCVLWRPARVLVFESSFKWHTFLFLMLFCSISAHFSEIQLVCDGRTDRPTDRRTDGHTLL